MSAATMIIDNAVQTLMQHQTRAWNPQTGFLSLNPWYSDDQGPVNKFLRGAKHRALTHKDMRTMLITMVKKALFDVANLSTPLQGSGPCRDLLRLFGSKETMMSVVSAVIEESLG